MQPIHRRSRLLKQSPAIAGAEIESGTPSDGDLLVYDAATNEWLKATELPAASYVVTGGYWEVRKDSATLYPQVAVYNGENTLWGGLGAAGSVSAYEAGDVWLYSDTGLVFDAYGGGNQTRLHLHDVSTIGHMDLTGGSYFRVFDGTDAEYLRLRAGLTNQYVEATGTMIMHLLNAGDDWAVQENFVTKLLLDTSAGNFQIRDGYQLSVYDATDTDRMYLYHNGTHFFTEFVGTSNWNINSAGGLGGHINISNTPIYLQPDGAGGSTDGDILIYFNIDRDWSLDVKGDDAAAGLFWNCRSNSKYLWIGDRFLEPKFGFNISDSGSKMRFYDGTTTANANVYASLDNDGTDFNITGGTSIGNLNIAGSFGYMYFTDGCGILMEGKSAEQISIRSSATADAVDRFIVDVSGESTRLMAYDNSAAVYRYLLTSNYSNGYVYLSSSNGGRVYMAGDGTGYFRAVTGNYGSVEVTGFEGSSGGYAGYSISGRVVFMHDDSTSWGIYNDANNYWLIQGTITGAVGLRYAGTAMLQTQSNTGADKTSGAQVLDGKSTMRDVGFNFINDSSQGGNVTLDETWCGYSIRTSSTGQTITVPDDTDIPAGFTCQVKNNGSGTVSIATSGTASIRWFDGSGTVSTGNRTLAVAGVATLEKLSDHVWCIYGVGLT